MTVDFHTHIFPDKIAKAAISKLAAAGDSVPFTDGTLAGLKKSMKEGGIDYSVILPVATNAHQFDSVNRFAAEINGKDGIFSFGGIHPDNENVEEKLDYIKSLGLKGIKLHPDYQKTFIDDERYIRIISHCIKIGLYVSIHSGIAVGYPDPVHCIPERALKLLKAVPQHSEPKIIFAHTGAFGMWNAVEKYLVGQNVYFDLAFCLDKIDFGQLARIIKNHGSDKILFGSDSPWASQKEYKVLLNAFPISDADKENIAFKNAFEILSIESFKTLTL